MSVQSALTQIEGVQSADISIKEKQAVVRYTPGVVQPERLIKAIEEAGFKANTNKAEKENTK